MAAVLLPLGRVKLLAEISSFAALLAFFAVNLALILLRYRMPDHSRPFRVPLAVGRMPLLPLPAIASICLLLANFESSTHVAGGIALLATAALYGLRYIWRGRC